MNRPAQLSRKVKGQWRELWSAVFGVHGTTSPAVFCFCFFTTIHTYWKVEKSAKIGYSEGGGVSTADPPGLAAYSSFVWRRSKFLPEILKRRTLWTAYISSQIYQSVFLMQISHRFMPMEKGFCRQIGELIINVHSCPQSSRKHVQFMGSHCHWSTPRLLIKLSIITIDSNHSCG